MFRRSTVHCLFESQMKNHISQMYEAHQRLKASPTYPGPIKAATPGQAECYPSRSASRILFQEGEKSYWRPVTDDATMPHKHLTIRVRFMTKMWVAREWQNRVHYQTVRVPATATISTLHHQMAARNTNGWFKVQTCTFAVQGKELPFTSTLQELGITKDNSVVDAVHDTNYNEHTPEVRPKDWNHDEITSEDEKTPWSKLMHQVPAHYGRPYMMRDTGHLY